MNRCWKRWIGLSTIVSFKTTHSIINTTSVCNKTTTLLRRPPIAAFATSFVSQASSSQGLGNEVSIDTKTLHPQSDQGKGTCDRNLDSEEEKQFKIIEKGDVVNLSDLLFTQNRDFLIRYGDPHLVTADELAGKVVLLCFVREDPYSVSLGSRSNTFIPSLIDVYNDLKHKNCFEVVFIFLGDACARRQLVISYRRFSQRKSQCESQTPFSQSESRSEPQIFEDIFSRMPWTAIPFSDVTLRKNLGKKFGIKDYSDYAGFVIESTGKVLQTHCCQHVIDKYGSPAYPFSDERIAFIDSEDKIIAKQPSLKSLLVSPQRDYVISNKGEKVQSSHFVGKRVIFYFESSYWDHVDDLVTFKDKVRFVNILKEIEFLTMLKERYLQMKGTDHEFEVIYIPYIYDEFCFSELVADLPWFVSPRIQWERIQWERGSYSVYFTYYGISYPTYNWPFLLAFGEDGRLVRRTICPKVMHEDFPFYAGSMEEEAYYKLSRHVFGDGYWYMYYEGLLRDSFSTK